jgi:hypothetical protein
MRVVWPFFLIVSGTALVIFAVGLAERCGAWIAGLRSRNSGSVAPSRDRSKALSTRIMAIIFRLVGMYVILAAAVGLFGIFLSR